MTDDTQHQLTIRLNKQNYYALKTLAEKRGESLAVVIRRFLMAGLQSEIALDAKDVLLAAVKKVLAQELRKTENRLSSLCAKAAISSASTEYLAAYILKNMDEPNLQNVRDACRKRGVVYVKEPLERIMQAYEDEEANK